MVPFPDVIDQSVLTTTTKKEVPRLTTVDDGNSVTRSRQAKENTAGRSTSTERSNQQSRHFPADVAWHVQSRFITNVISRSS